ncbi:transposase [Streptomyces sp. NPDC088354]|uniref:transposase n=1 Tax=Streptomyces sp. NPDC088354 TaxID=3365856 RepID=UPI00381EC0F7
MDWKYLLGLDLDDSGSDYSLLARFRALLVTNRPEACFLEAVLEVARGRGLLRRAGASAPVPFGWSLTSAC